MIDPRPCDACRRDAEHSHLVHLVTIDADTLRHRTDARLCPGCAAQELRKRRFGRPEVWALEAATEVLDRHFGEPVQVRWLNGDHRRWAVLCRRRHRLREPDPGGGLPQICAPTLGSRH